MRRFFTVLAAVLAVIALVPSGASAQSLASASGPAPGLDVATLATDGWTEEQPGFWTREVRPGVVQKLAFGAGRVELIPELQAELDLLVERISVEPSEKLFAAIGELSGTLANLTGIELDSGGAPDLLEKIGPCTPQNAYPNASVTIYPLPGPRGILVSSRVGWNDPQNLPCWGHGYARGEISLYSPVYGNVSDFDYCIANGQFYGACSVLIFDPYAYSSPSANYASCYKEGYAYLNLLDGQFVISETETSNTCY